MAAGRYSDLQLAAFVTAHGLDPLQLCLYETQETVDGHVVYRWWFDNIIEREVPFDLIIIKALRRNPEGFYFLLVPKAGLEPALLSEKHFECSASAISPLRLVVTRRF